MLCELPKLKVWYFIKLSVLAFGFLTISTKGNHTENLFYILYSHIPSSTITTTQQKDYTINILWWKDVSKNLFKSLIPLHANWGIN